MKTKLIRSMTVAAVSLSVFGGSILSATSAHAARTNDGDVDGRDFLIWQQGSSAPISTGDLATWQSNYGSGY